MSGGVGCLIVGLVTSIQSGCMVIIISGRVRVYSLDRDLNRGRVRDRGHDSLHGVG